MILLFGIIVRALNTTTNGSQVIRENKVTTNKVLANCLLRLWLFPESFGSCFLEKNQITEYATTIVIRQAPR